MVTLQVNDYLLRDGHIQNPFKDRFTIYKHFTILQKKTPSSIFERVPNMCQVLNMS